MNKNNEKIKRKKESDIGQFERTRLQRNKVECPK
jgi:hypothetical protein